MNANDIASALHEYVHRADLDTTANEPNALALSHSRIMRQFFPREAQLIVSLVPVAGAAPLPADFGAALSVSVSGRGQLRYVSQREYTDLYAGGVLGGVYTIAGPSLLVDPALVGLALNYGAKLAQPTGTQSDWLTLNYPDVWIHAAVAEQWRFVQDYEAANASTEHWQGLASEAMNQSERAARSGGGLTIRGR